ncbi:MAG: alpha/beta fold hydrolase [Pseudomonadota bacterium]|nr:alpha/beta fold hydrolase [Pseudomonadota bacterium]MDQ3161147.1 alpha/beta fold hydrolase [Pseudomonadota bacterium]
MSIAPPTTTTSPYRAPRWLRNPHVQTLLGSSQIRVLRGARELRRIGAVHAGHLVDAGSGIQLHGVHSSLPGRPPRGLALLLHGWEGSAESGYMRLSCARLLERGFDVFRLNFRDHGDTHHLNQDLFHSNRLDEVLQAALTVSRRWASQPTLPLVLAGYSLGGNFALRVALHAPRIGLRLARVAAVCPALDPDRTTTAMEQGLSLYERYFLRKWTRSLRRKQVLFPQEHAIGEEQLRSRRLRGLTAWLVARHTEFADVEAYFDGYRISGDRMAGLQVPADILTSADDPVIPIDDFHTWQLPSNATVEIAAHGGHCAFLCDASLRGYAEGWIAQRLSVALDPDLAQPQVNTSAAPA